MNFGDFPSAGPWAVKWTDASSLRFRDAARHVTVLGEPLGRSPIAREASPPLHNSASPQGPRVTSPLQSCEAPKIASDRRKCGTAQFSGASLSAPGELREQVVPFGGPSAPRSTSMLSSRWSRSQRIAACSGSFEGRDSLRASVPVRLSGLCTESACIWCQSIRQSLASNRWYPVVVAAYTTGMMSKWNLRSQV